MLVYGPSAFEDTARILFVEGEDLALTCKWLGRLHKASERSLPTCAAVRTGAYRCFLYKKDGPAPTVHVSSNIQEIGFISQCKDVFISTGRQ